jgi:hypothetical protein
MRIWVVALVTLAAGLSAKASSQQIDMPAEEAMPSDGNWQSRGQADTVEMPAEETADEAAQAAEAAAQAAEDAGNAAEASARPYYRRGRWKITRGYGTCTALSDQGALYDYDERLGTVEITISDKSIRSLREGEVRRLKSAFIERASKKAFNIQTSPFKAKLYGTSTFLQSTFDVQILEPLARYDIIAFWTDQRVLVRAFDLTGSAVMIANLRKCAAQESALHPSDPFTR